MTNISIDVPTSINEIDNVQVRERLELLIEEPHVLGIMLWGSRATGFALPNTDWDALIYVTDDYYNSLELNDTIWLEFDESIEPKRLVIDFSPISDAWFEQQIDSPLDIDHFPYVEGVVIHDSSGKLEEWRKKLAEYPEDQHLERLKNKYVLMQGAVGAAHIDTKREFHYDAKVNLYRAIVAGVNLWFTIKKSWTPPLKWWSMHAKKIGMSDETFKVFCDALDNPSMTTVGTLYKQLRQLILDDGYEFPNDPITTFLETIHPDGRPGQIRHSYM
ncbi:MAG: DUF4037 domain-containing protein [Candidatus Lokiarchaeota archaeon]|nr:DUF4037 domain-containing protein [Candidatus Lokiarchaeota archaeon]